MLAGTLLVSSGCSREENSRQNARVRENNMDFLNDTTPFTIIIPSVVSEQKLKITLPRCHFGKLREGKVNGSESNGTVLFFPMATFSNNVQGVYACPVSDEPYAKITIDALFPYPGEKELQFGNYWQKLRSRGARAIEHNNGIKVYLTSPRRLSAFVNQSDSSLEDYKLTFSEDPETSGGFADHLDVYTVFKGEFSLHYTVLSSNLIHDKRFPYPKFKTDPWFADRLIEIYTRRDGLSNHPQVLEAFTENNNRIVEYFYRHSEIIKGE